MSKQIFDAKKIGTTIRQKRMYLGYTQLSLSKELKITEVYMNNIEMGKHLPSNKLMRKIFDKLGIKMKISLE